jgi:adenylate cyclase
VVTPSRVDGVTRELPLIIDDSASFRPSLALAGLAVATGVPPEQLILQPNAVQLGDRAIPTAGAHRLTINFAAGFDRSGTPGYLSAAEVLAGEAPSQLVGELVNNRVVLVGVADENLGDHQLTPLAKIGGQPGVSIHANALNTILRDSYLITPKAWTTRITIFVSTLILSILILLVGLRVGLAAAGLFIVGLFIWSIGPAASSGSLIDVVWPSIGAVLAAGGGIALRYFVADRQRRRASDLFRQYVPASVSDELLARGLLDQQVEGVRVDVTTMFCDLRGFTAMTHELGPQVLRSILNHYYEYATAIVERHKGTLMQFVGDEVYAVFGAPLPSDDHHRRAVLCAIDLIDEVDMLDETLTSHGFPTIRFGVGVATGSAIAAHVGSSSRRQYTVVGDAVNLGARLCSQARADQVVVSDLAAEHAGLANALLNRSELMSGNEALQLKGFDEPYPVVRVQARVTGAIA